MPVNDSSAKRYFVKIVKTTWVKETNSAYGFLESKETIKEFNGNHKECLTFLEPAKKSYSKYDFKNRKTFSIKNKSELLAILGNFTKSDFLDTSEKNTNLDICLDYKIEPETQKDFTGCVILRCAVSRSVFRLFTENQYIRSPNLSSSDVSNIKAGIRHFDFERALQIAGDANMLSVFFEIFKIESERTYKSIIYQRPITNHTIHYELNSSSSLLV